MLAAVILYQGTSTDRHSGRGRNWNQALQTADAGVEEADLRSCRRRTASFPPTSRVRTPTARTPWTVTYLGRNRYQIEMPRGTRAPYRVSRPSGMSASSWARPSRSSTRCSRNSSVDTKNNDVVNGDIWANDEVTVDLNDIVNGSVTSATKYVTMKNGSEITGDVHTGGYDSAGYALKGTIVGGNVKAVSTAPNDCADDRATATTRSRRTRSAARSRRGAASRPASPTAPRCSPECASPRRPRKSFPQFIYNPANYDPAPVSVRVDSSAFQTYVTAHKNDMKGTFVVGGSAIGSEQLRRHHGHQGVGRPHHHRERPDHRGPGFGGRHRGQQQRQADGARVVLHAAAERGMRVERRQPRRLRDRHQEQLPDLERQHRDARLRAERTRGVQEQRRVLRCRVRGQHRDEEQPGHDLRPAASSRSSASAR